MILKVFVVTSAYDCEAKYCDIRMGRPSVTIAFFVSFCLCKFILLKKILSRSQVQFENEVRNEKIQRNNVHSGIIFTSIVVIYQYSS